MALKDLAARAAYMREYYGKNRDKIKAWQSAENKKMTIRWRAIAFAILGNVCVCCGEAEQRFLTVDHIKGGGKQHRKERGRIWLVYKDVAHETRPGIYRLLCMNCNWAIRHGAICPHQEV
jgi:hypothetical protein